MRKRSVIVNIVRDFPPEDTQPDERVLLLTMCMSKPSLSVDDLRALSSEKTWTAALKRYITRRLMKVLLLPLKPTLRHEFRASFALVSVHIVSYRVDLLRTFGAGVKVPVALRAEHTALQYKLSPTPSPRGLSDILACFGTLSHGGRFARSWALPEHPRDAERAGGVVSRPLVPACSTGENST